MYNLTHDESSSVDIGGVWTGPDEFELTFKFNADDEDDLNIVLVLNTEEVQSFVEYLQANLTYVKVQ
jgi:hypothetical protein